MHHSYSADAAILKKEFDSKFELLANVLLLAERNPRHSHSEFPRVMRMIRAAANVEQVGLLVNGLDQNLGYVLWACLDDDVDWRFRSTRNFQLNDFEWNEGSNLWVMDMYVAAGNIWPVISHLRQQALATTPVVNYFRETRNVTKICSWRPVSLRVNPVVCPSPWARTNFMPDVQTSSCDSKNIQAERDQCT